MSVLASEGQIWREWYQFLLFVTKIERFSLLGFTLKALICIDMFLKSCTKLKLNTWVRPSRLKEPEKNKGTAPANRMSYQLIPYTTELVQKQELCVHSFHLKPMTSAEDAVYSCIQKEQQEWKEIHLWRILNAERLCTCICTFASIFSCSVNHRPV